MSDPNAQPSNGAKLAKSAGRALKRIARKHVKKAVLHLLKVTAPYWGPPVFLLFMAYMAYVILFSLPQEAMQAAHNVITQVEAFFGVTEDPNGGADVADPTLFTSYKKIADTWDTGLTPEQQKQVLAYKFPWSVLAGVDRVVNDEAVWDGKQNVKPNPQAVYNALKPKFKWKDSTITTVTVTTSTDSKGNTTTSTSTDIQHVSLVTSADTLEGHFEYTYQWQTTTQPNVIVTREVVKQVKRPSVYYQPLKHYLETSRGIKDEATFEMVEQLALTYDSEYSFNVALQSGQNFATYPTYALAYAEAVQAITQEQGIPQPLFLALIAHESGGNWKAVNNANTNGTTDAGLCQINSVNWATYGMTDNPYDIKVNIHAGAAILGHALNSYSDFTQALYAYNGGTPSNGATYNPSYAPAVLSIFDNLQSTPAFAVLVPALGDQPLTILAAEQSGPAWAQAGQSGKNFTNPVEITVVDTRTVESQTVPRTSGDGSMWASQAWVYHPALKDVQKGDTLKVQFRDGATVEAAFN